MSYLERALQVADVPYPCLTCGTNLSEGVLYCPPCWERKQAEREARRVLAFDPNKRRRNPTVRDEVTRPEDARRLSQAAGATGDGSTLPRPCLSGSDSGSGGPSGGAL